MSHTGGVVNCDETTWDSDRGDVLRNKRQTEVTVSLGDVVGAAWMPPEGHEGGDEQEKEGKEVAKELVETSTDDQGTGGSESERDSFDGKTRTVGPNGQGAFQASDRVVVDGACSLKHRPCESIQVWIGKVFEKYEVVAEVHEHGRFRCQEFAKEAAGRVRQDEMEGRGTPVLGGSQVVLRKHTVFMENPR